MEKFGTIGTVLDLAVLDISEPKRRKEVLEEGIENDRLGRRLS